MLSHTLMCFYLSLGPAESMLLSLSLMIHFKVYTELEGKVIKLTGRLICQKCNMLTQRSLSTTKESTVYLKTERADFAALKTLPNGAACFQSNPLSVLAFRLDANGANG